MKSVIFIQPYLRVPASGIYIEEPRNICCHSQSGLLIVNYIWISPENFSNWFFPSIVIPDIRPDNFRSKQYSGIVVPINSPVIFVGINKLGDESGILVTH